MHQDPTTIYGSIQLSVRIKDTAFDIIIDGNAYNPTIVDDLTNRMQTLMRVGFTTAIDNGYQFEPFDDEDFDEDEA